MSAKTFDVASAMHGWKKKMQPAELRTACTRELAVFRTQWLEENTAGCTRPASENWQYSRDAFGRREGRKTSKKFYLSNFPHSGWKKNASRAVRERP